MTARRAGTTTRPPRGLCGATDIPRAAGSFGSGAHMRAIVAITALVIGISFADVRPGAAQPADTILVNGKILTLDERSSVTQAIAIRGDSIIATGASDDI